MMWTCSDTEAALGRGEQPRGDDALAHVRSCPLCAALVSAGPDLVRGLGHLDETSGPDNTAALGGLLDRIETEVDQERGLRRLKSLKTLWRISLAIAPALGYLAITPGVARRSDWPVYPMGRLGVEIAGYLLLTGLVARAELRPAHRRPAVAAGWLVALLALTLPALVALVGPAHTDWPDSLQGTGADFWPRALACLRFGLLLAAPVGAWLLVLGRRGPGSFGDVALVAALGSLAGNLALHVHCPLTGLGHLLVGHASVGLILLALGTLWYVRRQR
jgi:hypothetical protein